MHLSRCFSRPAPDSCRFQCVAPSGASPRAVAAGRAALGTARCERAMATPTAIAGTSAGCLFEACARRSVVSADLLAAYADLGSWTDAQLPLVYSDRYNITFFGIERLHPFDSCKFGKVVKGLIDAGVVRREQLVAPVKPPSDSALLDVHTDAYLREIHSSNLRIVQITELPPLLLLPNFLLQRAVVTPMKFHVGGTMMAAALAVQRGWSVNVGGGMHHASAEAGMGWCPFDDIVLAIRRLRIASGGAVKKVLYIDLDAHQGNGVGRDKLRTEDDDIFIVDLYNGTAFPRDDRAKLAIDVNVELRPGTSDKEYLTKLRGALDAAARKCPSPDLVVYNAGTDILEGDPLGRLAVSAAGVIERDRLVWQHALDAASPICMLLSGGYHKNSAAVIRDSLLNLFETYRLGDAPAGSGLGGSAAGETMAA